MALVYSTTVAQNRLQKVIDNIDLGASAGVLVIGTSALSGATGVIATFTLSDPSGTIAGRVLTFSGMPKTANATATGTAVKAELRDSNGTVVASGLTVGLAGSGANIIISRTAITSGQGLQLTSLTITHP